LLKLTRLDLINSQTQYLNPLLSKLE